MGYRKSGSFFSYGKMKNVFKNMSEGNRGKGDFYGLETIEKVLGENKHLDAKSMAKYFKDDLISFCNGEPIHDDVTLIAAKGK